MFKNLKVYLTLGAFIVISVLLILNDIIGYGLILLVFAIVIFWVWQFFNKKQKDENEKLNTQVKQKEQENQKLKSENEELRNRKFNISEIRNILDLGLMEISTNLTRTWNEKFKHNERSVHFIGALEIKVTAKYGIDLKELRIKYDRELNTVYVANINPKFLSFTDLDSNWIITELMEYKVPFISANHWRKSSDLGDLGAQIQENLRKKTHQEIKQGPKELKWVIEPLKKQIHHTLEFILGKSNCNVEFVEQFDDSFKPLDEHSSEDKNMNANKT